MKNPGFWLTGGVAGVASICCYVAAIAVNWPETQLGVSLSLVVASAFPVLGIMASYALYSFIAAERESVANTLGLIFFIVAFTTLLSMLVVQLAVTSRIGDIASKLNGETAMALRRGLRMIDLGLDVAWDILGGIGLVCWGQAISKRRGFGRGWGIPAAVFGIALIVLNAATFPIPPGNGGLVDVGPLVGLFMLVLFVRLALLGRRAAGLKLT